MSGQMIGVYNQKGGVTKTATAVTLADLLARGMALRPDRLATRRVLLVDWDPQGNATMSLGVALGQNLHDWLLAESAAGVMPWVQETRPGLFLLAGNQKTRRAARIIRDDIADGLLEGQHIQVKLGMLRAQFDAVVIDMPPQQGEWCEEVLSAQPDVVIIPASMDHMDLVGVRTAYHTVREVAPAAQIIVLPTLFHTGWNLDEDNLAKLKAGFPGLVAEPIPYRALAREIRSGGWTIGEYKPANSGERTVKEELLRAFTALLGWISQPTATVGKGGEHG